MTNPDYEMHLRPEEDYEMHFDDAGLKPEQTATVMPDYETQTVRPDPGCVFSEVTVEAIPEPTEEIDITENGVVDVARYGTANVAVPVGVFPSGTKVITENVTGEDVTNYAAVDVAVPGPSGTKQISITANGTTTEDVTNYADAKITVNTRPPAGTFYQIVSEKVTIGENTISNVAELISYLETAVRDYNEGKMISYSLSERIEIDYAVWFRRWNDTLIPGNGVAGRWRSGSLGTANENIGYTAYVPPNTTYIVYIAKGDAS